MGYYTLTARRQREFKHHIIIGVRQIGSPQEVYFLQFRLARKVAQESAGVIR
jgi:hypothetical protein